MIQSEFVAWADGEAARIERGESQRYHACFCDPPYGLEFMGKEWDRPKPPGLMHEPASENRMFDNGSGHFWDNKQGQQVRYAAGNDYQAWTRQWASALIPLLYPGALVFCFGGTRTWHRLACGFEDAGFQIWDTLMWLHGQGFPKAQDISKLIDKTNGDKRKVTGVRKRDGGPAGFTVDKGWNDGPMAHDDSTVGISVPASTQSAPWVGHKTAALKPAWEPVLCFKAPTQGKTYAELAMEYGSGALNVDGGRIGLNPGYRYNADRNGTTFHGEQGARIKQSAEKKGSQFIESTQGRYPANLALECTCGQVHEKLVQNKWSPRIKGNGWGGPRDTEFRTHENAIVHTDPDCPAAMLDAQAEESVSSGGQGKASRLRTGTGASYGWTHPKEWDGMGGYKDRGGPSRFFYCAKASRCEREAGCGDLALHRAEFGTGGERRLNDPAAKEARGRTPVETAPIRNDHPTVKPLALCRWLATLLLPPPLRAPSLRSQESDGPDLSGPQIGPESRIPRRLLVPFAGTGSEMIGALEAGWDDVTGIEQDAHYREIAQARIGEFNNREPLFRGLEVGI